MIYQESKPGFLHVKTTNACCLNVICVCINSALSSLATSRAFRYLSLLMFILTVS